MTHSKSKKELFVLEYVKDFNGTQAAIRAGYTERSAKQTASRLLTIDDEVRELLIKVSSKVRDKSIVDAAYVLDRAAEIEQLDPLDIMQDNGALKPLSEWPKSFRTAINSFEVEEVYEHAGDGVKVLSGQLKKVKWTEKHKYLDMIGKHEKVSAFKPTSQTDISINFPSSIEIVAGDGS